MIGILGFISGSVLIVFSRHIAVASSKGFADLIGSRSELNSKRRITVNRVIIVLVGMAIWIFSIPPAIR